MEIQIALGKHANHFWGTRTKRGKWGNGEESACSESFPSSTFSRAWKTFFGMFLFSNAIQEPPDAKSMRRSIIRCGGIVLSRGSVSTRRCGLRMRLLHVSQSYFPFLDKGGPTVK